MPAPRYPDPAPGVTRATSSTVERYLKCGIWPELDRASRHRHATVRMCLGTGVGAGAAADAQAKLDTGAGIKLGDLRDVAVQSYEREVSECEVPDSKLEIAAGVDDVAAAALAYGQRVAPIVKDVLAVEEPILAMISDGFELAGTPDRVEAGGLADLKTGREWGNKDADRSRQLTIYGLLHRAQFGRFPSRLWIDNVHRERGGWTATRIYTARGPGEYAGVLQVLEAARKGMEAGVALPAPEGAWWCSASWCPHFGRTCPVTRKLTV